MRLTSSRRKTSVSNPLQSVRPWPEDGPKRYRSRACGCSAVIVFAHLNLSALTSGSPAPKWPGLAAVVCHRHCRLAGRQPSDDDKGEICYDVS
jgi:hypothetical protein